MENKLVAAIDMATVLGYTVSFKRELNMLSIRLTKRIDKGTIKQFDQVLPLDDGHYNDFTISNCISFIVQHLAKLETNDNRNKIS